MASVLSFLYSLLILAIALLTSQCDGLSLTSSNRASSFSRRNVFRKVASASTLLPITAGSKANALNINEGLIDVYFGCGCFWHVQHEFVEAEKKILNRDDSSLTARAGYAGGLGSSDKVCYHNAVNIGDYGKLGHAEVVALRIPPSSFEEFAVEYFKLFDNNGYRPDQNGDRGPEYRNLIGIPDGSKSELAGQIVSASKSVGDKLDFAVGKGNDGDLRAVSFIMDSNKFPFFIAEQYHQFHDGFKLNENYPNSYNSLATKLANEGKLVESKCPNGMFGVGIQGL